MFVCHVAFTFPTAGSTWFRCKASHFLPSLATRSNGFRSLTGNGESNCLLWSANTLFRRHFFPNWFIERIYVFHSLVPKRRSGFLSVLELSLLIMLLVKANKYIIERKHKEKASKPDNARLFFFCFLFGVCVCRCVLSVGKKMQAQYRHVLAACSWFCLSLFVSSQQFLAICHLPLHSWCFWACDRFCGFLLIVR